MSAREPPAGAAPDDELRALQEAFRSLPAPLPVRALEDEDETTRRTVAWLADAWRALPSPALPARPEAPAAVTPIATARTRRVRFPRVAAAAAVLAVALGLAWLLDGRATPGEATPAPVARPPADGGSRPAPTTPWRVAAAPDRLELTSGPVRLVLFTDVPDTPMEIPR